MGIKTLKEHQTLALCLHEQAIAKIHSLYFLDGKNIQMQAQHHDSSIHQAHRPYLDRLGKQEGAWTKFGAILLLTG